MCLLCRPIGVRPEKWTSFRTKNTDNQCEGQNPTCSTCLAPQSGSKIPNRWGEAWITALLQKRNKLAPVIGHSFKSKTNLVQSTQMMEMFHLLRTLSFAGICIVLLLPVIPVCSRLYRLVNALLRSCRLSSAELPFRGSTAPMLQTAQNADPREVTSCGKPRAQWVLEWLVQRSPPSNPLTEHPSNRMLVFSAVHLAQ